MTMGGGKGAHQATVFSLFPERDPVRKQIIPCIVRYAKEVWLASDTQLFHPKVIPCGQLYSGMLKVLNQQKKRPRRTGPLSNLLRCLAILEWDMKDPIRLIDHNGEELNLTIGSPELLKERLHEAATELHYHEVVKRIAKKNFGAKQVFDDFRVNGPDLDELRKIVNSPKYPYQTRRAIAQVAAGSYIVADTLIRNAVRIAPTCPFCKGPTDSIMHRITDCSPLRQLREECIPDNIRAWLREGGRQSILALTCIGTNPIPHNKAVEKYDHRLWKEMSENGEIIVSDTAPAREPFFPRDEGDVFLDGSCKNPRSKNAARAGWACVQVDERGNFVRSMSGTVHHGIKQAAVTGEYCGIAHAMANVEQGTVLLGDCLGVVQNFHKGYVHAAGPKKKYGNFWREIHQRFGNWTDYASLLKVKAHVDKSTLEDEGEIYLATGNELADLEAKEAVDRHRCGPTDLERAAFHQAWTKDVAVAIGTFLGKLPPTRELYETLPEEQIERDQPQQHHRHEEDPEEQRPEPITAPADFSNIPMQHSWVQVGSKWKCRTCMRQSAQQESCRVPCGLIPPSLKAAVTSEFGHKLMTARTAHTDIWCMWCAVCGGWASGRAFVLKRPCEGSIRVETKSHARVTLRAVNRRMHPATGESLTVPWPLVGLRERGA